MANNAEKDRLWRKICELDQHIRSLAKDSKGRVSEAFKNAQRDMQKLKAEYERAAGKGSFNPTSIEHGERMTRNKVFGDQMGRTGEGSHYGLED